MTWVEVPSDYDKHSLAEFIEAELLFSEDDYLSLTELRGLFPVGRQPSDDEMAFAFAEIEQRRGHYGSHYPYLVDDRGVLFGRGRSALLYSFLLLMSLKGTPVRDRREYARSDPIFDAVAREAFRALQGSQAKALVFGWPARDGRPTAFDQAVVWAAQQMGITTRNEPIPEHLQDAGVDVIVWRPFPDGRNGFQIILVQNTVQWSFRKKPHDVRPNRWFIWWNVGTPPGIGFAVPFAMPEGDIWWEDVTDGPSIVMDRGRLLHALQEEEPTGWPEWELLEDFVEQEVANVRAAGEFVADSGPTVPRPRRKAKKSV